MNFTYFKFLFITTIKKRPVWITWLIFLLTCGAFLLILPGVAKINTIQLWANTTMPICQSFLGMAGALYAGILAIHIFKDGNEEGTELVVFSKPISRIKITLTKFFVYAAMCLIVNASCVALTSFTAFLPKTEHQFYWKLLVSLFVGNLVAFGIFGSISILLTVKFAKAGVIITDVMISLIFIIYQILALFTIKTPLKSLTDNGMGAASYTVQDRNMETGEYTEKELVSFHANTKNLTADHPNFSTNWKEMKSYWTDEISKNDVTPILNATDLAGQVALSYLSVGLDGYSSRQAKRNFAISRYYKYTLDEPASPELITEEAGNNRMKWIYNSYTTLKLVNPSDPEGDYLNIRIPGDYGFAAIPPVGSSRLAGYGDKTPVGNYLKTGELLSFKDVYFEPDQWKKYSKPFQLMYDNIFKPEYYQIYFPAEYGPDEQLTLWQKTNAALGHYYDIVWSCFTGNSTSAEYLGPESPLKDYGMKEFDINSVSDINERFIQFKYFACLKAQEEQAKLLNAPYQIELERQAKQSLIENPEYYITECPSYWLSVFGCVPSMDNWMFTQDEERLIHIIEPGTHAPAIQFIYDAYWLVNLMTLDNPNRNQILKDTTQSKLLKTMSIFNSCSRVEEEFLYSSMAKPSRSATYHGKAYVCEFEWVPYIRTLEALLSKEAYELTGQAIIPASGHNMEWFFFSYKPTRKYWMYAVIWGIISLATFAAGAIVYYKYDVK